MIKTKIKVLVQFLFNVPYFFTNFNDVVEKHGQQVMTTT